MIKAIKVVAETDFTILVNLEDGRVFEVDLSFIQDLSGPVVDPLKSEEGFRQVFVRNGIVTWPSGYDIDPYFLVEQGQEVEQTG